LGAGCGAEDGRAGYKNIGPCLAAFCGGLHVDAAVDFEFAGRVVVVDQLSQRSNALDALAQECLPAKSGPHGHAQCQVDLSEVRLQRLDRRTRIDDHPHALLA
jgi:hypothetical protein